MKTPKLTSTEYTLTGLELIKLIREFIRQRCDVAGLQNHDDWYSTLELWERNDITEEEFTRRHEQLTLRGTLRSISAAKEFVELQAKYGNIGPCQGPCDRAPYLADGEEEVGSD